MKFMPSAIASLLALTAVGATSCAEERSEPSVSTVTAPLVMTGWHTAIAPATDTEPAKPEIHTPGGDPFRIEAINWYGFETRDAVAHGLYAVDYLVMLQYIKDAGFNTVRIPFSNSMWESNPSVRSGSVSACAACDGKTSREILALIITGAGSLDLHVILDNHRSSAGNSAEGNGLWYTDSFTEQDWIRDWREIQAWVNGVGEDAPSFLTARDNNPIVLGYDLRNEPHTGGKGKNPSYLDDGATWGIGDHDPIEDGPNPNPFDLECVATSTCVDWRLAAERVGTTLLGDAADPANNWPFPLLFVEGIGIYVNGSGNEESSWWGGMLKGPRGNSVVPGAPIVFNAGRDVNGPTGLGAAVPNQLVYSAHDYGPMLYQQDWFNSDTCYASGCSASSLSDLWFDNWGYLTSNIDPVWSGGAYPWDATGHENASYSMAPVLVGEFGTGNADSDMTPSGPGTQGQWFTSMIHFIKASSEDSPTHDPGVPVHNLHWAYWALNGNDDYSLLNRDWDGIESADKVNTFLCAIQSNPESCSGLLPDPDGDATPGPFCGDASCNSEENACSCAEDCGPPPSTETSCDDGIDNDCNSEVDCDDSSCSADAACVPSGNSCGDGTCDPGEDCTSCSGDCEGSTKGKPRSRFCCGDGTQQSAESSALCDGNF